MKAVVIFLVAILIVGGIKPFLQAIGVLEDTVIGFSPLLYTGINEYVSTPYFITGGIMAIASIAGVVIGRKQGQVIYYIVSVISAVMGLASFSIPFFQ